MRFVLSGGYIRVENNKLNELLKANKEKLKNVKEIIFENCDFFSWKFESGKSLAELFKKISNVSEIKFIGCTFSDDQIGKLADTEDLSFDKLKEISLWEVDFSNLGNSVLADLLTKFSVVEKLDLSRCIFGLDQIASLFKDIGLCLNNLREINLSGIR